MTQTNNKSTAFLAILIAWLFYLCSYIARAEPSVLANDLMSEFHVTSSIVGLCVSVMYMAYVPLQIPCGLITDKIGVKKMLFASGMLCAIGAFVFGIASSVLQLEIGRFLIGAASAPSFLCCGKVASEFFDKKKFAMLMGVAMAMGCFGGVAGTAPFAALASKIGWRPATFVVAAVCALIGILALIFVKEKVEEAKSNEKKPHILEGLRILVRDKKVWVLGFYGMITYLPLSALAELWGVPFMQLRYGVSTEKAALSSVAIFVGFGLGGIISAWVAEKLNSYKKAIILFTLGLTACFATVMYSDSLSFNSCLAFMLLGGLFAGANTLCFTLVLHLVPKGFAGTSTGFMNTLIMLSGIIFQPLLGWLLDFFRNGKVTAEGSPIYDLVMYRSALMFVIGGMILATIVTFFINDLKHQEEEV